MLRLQMLRVKTILGQNVTGSMLVGLARAYVGAINSDAVPNIGEAWDEVARSECHAALTEALNDFKNSLGKHASRAALPLDEADLSRLFKTHKADAFAVFDARAIGYAGCFAFSRGVCTLLMVLATHGCTERSGASKAVRAELKVKLNSEYGALLAANAEASEKHCSRLLIGLRRTVFDPHIVNGDNYKNVKDLDSDIKSFLAQYVAGAKGPAKFKQFSDFLAVRTRVVLCTRNHGAGL